MSQRALIVGGGIAALEAAIALRQLGGDRIATTIHSPREDFIYRPFAVGEPFGASPAMRYDLQALADRCGASFQLGSIVAVDGEARRARTHDDEEISYDHLLVACGTRLLAGIPGAMTYWGVAEDPAIEELIRELADRQLQRVAFTMPAGRTWALPMYELALLAGSRLSRVEVDASLVVVTPEDSPLHLFGRHASERVGALLAERGIEVVTGATPIGYGDGVLRTAPGAGVEADAVLSLPRIEGRRIDGVPHDADGFIAVDEHCRIRGMPAAFAVGDVTSFPVKQGGVATQQADLAVETILAELDGEAPPEPFDPILRGVLWTGAEPLYMSSHLVGGHGETSLAGEEPLWEGAATGKIVSRYLTPFLDQLDRPA